MINVKVLWTPTPINESAPGPMAERMEVEARPSNDTRSLKAYVAAEINAELDLSDSEREHWNVDWVIGDSGKWNVLMKQGV